MPITFDSLVPLLHVFDMQASLRFYCDILGFSIVSTSTPVTNFYWALLKRGDLTLMLNTAYEEDERPATPDPVRFAAHSDTALYFSCDNPRQVCDYLRDHDWPAHEPNITHYGMTQVYTRDPDGYQICFQSPT
ncbi:MAG: VOC family protein [Planctomycetales bacterium]